MNDSDTESLVHVFTHREWISSWLGTAISGSIFGLFEGFSLDGIDGAILGSVLGLCFAGIVGAVIFPTVASLLWIFCLLNRNKFLETALAGGHTGFVCAFGSWPTCLVTASLGAAGGCLPALMNRQRETAAARFSIQGMLLRTLVVAILLAIWKFLIHLFNNPQDW